MIALLLAAVLAPGCTAVDGERILAGDLARGWPEFAAVEASLALAYAPVPGARRVFGRAELARLAARFQLAPPAAGLCVERRTAALTQGQVLAAMQAALGMPEARIAVVEWSRGAVPEGALVFPKEALRAPGPGTPPGAPVLWRGAVRYGGGKRFPVWARVIVSAPAARVRAAVELRAGEVVRAEQLRLEQAEGFPLGRREASTLEQVAGRRPRRTIPADAIIPPDLLDEPRDVERGDTVQVEVASGAARLTFAGRAESAGSAGQAVQVRNPDSRRLFPARVAGKGAVAVEAKGAQH